MNQIIKTILYTGVMILSTQLKAQKMEVLPEEYKTVMQVSSNDTLLYKGVVKQLTNLLNAFDKISIEVVVHGPGVEFLLLNSPLKNNMELLNQKGVIFLICQNTLNEKKVAVESLFPFVKVVPSGLAHIIIRQSEGWSYIKAGF